uniref:YfiR family protein n=1 Tax=Marinobacterium profundum TaxID=1714300 RepID=UPI000830C0AD|nr:YfiR family protein [Marinobacterium profundum]
MKQPILDLLRLLCLGVSLLLAQGTVASDHPDIAAEARIKAAFLFKFGHYVEWPAAAFTSASSPLVIGVMGAPAIARELSKAVAGRQIQQRPLQVVNITAPRLPANLHLLYVAHAHSSGTTKAVGNPLSWQSQLKERAVLVITGSPDGLESGSSINFEIVDNRVRFDIALDSARAHNLKLSSRLLAVARRVQGRAQ